jgi:hypothetical protein
LAFARSKVQQDEGGNHDYRARSYHCRGPAGLSHFVRELGTRQRKLVADKLGELTNGVAK